jgi:hypothetical protein
MTIDVYQRLLPPPSTQRRRLSMPVISSLKPSNPPQPAQVAQPAVAATPAAGIQFFCDGCTTPIPGTSARVHCLTCPDYDACANCALAERFGGTHTAAHPTEVYRMSGTGDSTVQPVRSRAVVTYTMPGAANAAYAAPPAYTSPGTSQGGTFAGQSVPGGVDDNISGATTGGTTAGGMATSAATGPTDGWGPFFDADLNPSPAYTALMSTIFGYLDSARTGFLPPEAYSRFADDMGYPTHENICKLRQLFLSLTYKKYVPREKRRRGRKPIDRRRRVQACTRLLWN